MQTAISSNQLFEMLVDNATDEFRKLQKQAQQTEAAIAAIDQACELRFQRHVKLAITRSKNDMEQAIMAIRRSEANRN